MKSQKKIAVVIMAAGASKRMGHIKQLLPWKSTTLLGNAIEQAEQCRADAIYVIVGANAEKIKDHLAHFRVHWILNRHYTLGMGTSVAIAAKTLVSSKKKYDGLLIMLADQPFIDASYLDRMIQMFQRNEKSIIATAYGHKKGVPALFATIHFRALSELNNDIGAKKLISTNQNNALAMEPEGKQLDLDTYQAYQQALKELNQ